MPLRYIISMVSNATLKMNNDYNIYDVVIKLRRLGPLTSVIMSARRIASFLIP